MAVTKLIYYVINIRSPRRDDWVVRCEQECYGPFPTCREASAWAAAEADAANALGFAGAVRVGPRGAGAARPRLVSACERFRT